MIVTDSEMKRSVGDQRKEPRIAIRLAILMSRESSSNRMLTVYVSVGMLTYTESNTDQACAWLLRANTSA